MAVKTKEKDSTNPTSNPLVKTMGTRRISFVKAKEDDWPKVLQFELAAKSETYSAIENEKDIRAYLKDSNVFFIKLGDALIGTASFKSEKDDSAYLDGLTLLVRYRGSGFGAEAMDLIMEKIKGFKKATIRVHPKNSSALILYLKAGFSIIRWEENHYGDGQPRLFLEKILK
jgi:ribosomal protein S18 acetylase RimI-like enzyme